MKKRREGDILKRGGKVLLFSLILLFTSYLFIPSFSEKEVLVKIPKGANTKEISFILYKNKIIGNPYFFLLLVKILNCEGKLKAGVYEFKSPTLLSTFDVLLKGKVKIYKITFPEGLPKWEVAGILARRKIVEEEKFLEVVENAGLFYKDFPWLKNEKSLEGYLFPDTYYFTLDEDPEKVVKEFLTRFEQKVLPLYNTYLNQKENPLSLHEVVVLASIVEKEAKVDFEKPIIAGVFYNRLKKGMKLMADPTIKYALRDFNVRLDKKMLIYPSSYNTYIYPGLPPGPICNPGTESVKATLWPAEIDYLYFVARGDGTHEFSTTYRDHLEAIKKYKRG